MTLHPQYVTDTNGRPVSVLLPMKEFKSILEELEDIEDVRMYDRAKGEPSIPIHDAFKSIEAKRQKKK